MKQKKSSSAESKLAKSKQPFLYQHTLKEIKADLKSRTAKA